MDGRGAVAGPKTGEEEGPAGLRKFSPGDQKSETCLRKLSPGDQKSGGGLRKLAVGDQKSEIGLDKLLELEEKGATVPRKLEDGEATYCRDQLRAEAGQRPPRSDVRVFDLKRRRITSVCISVAAYTWPLDSMRTDIHALVRTADRR